MTRRRGLRIGAVGVGAVAVLAVAVTAARDGRPRPQAPVAASEVIAASGPAGVVVVRDGTVIRMDQQSPPGRLVVPPPPTGPEPDGIAVGAHRVWVSSGGLVRGYGPGGATIRVFRVAPAGALAMAEAGGRLWAGVRGGRAMAAGELSERPVRLRPTALPGALVALTATRREGWAVLESAGGRTTVVRARPGARRATVVARLPGLPRGVAAGVRTVWVLTQEGLLRIDARTGAQRGPFPAPAGAREVAAGPGRAVVSDPLAGVVRERTLVGRVTDHRVGLGARGLAATATGFWVSVGDAATPVMTPYG